MTYSNAETRMSEDNLHIPHWQTATKLVSYKLSPVIKKRQQHQEEWNDTVHFILDAMQHFEILSSKEPKFGSEENDLNFKLLSLD